MGREYIIKREELEKLYKEIKAVKKDCMSGEYLENILPKVISRADKCLEILQEIEESHVRL